MYIHKCICIGGHMFMYVHKCICINMHTHNVSNWRLYIYVYT